MRVRRLSPSVALAGLLVALASCLVAPHAGAQDRAPEPAANGTPEQPAFDLDVRAPNRLRDLLSTHLSLRRYRDVPDLEESEIERLVGVAETEVRQLMATQGFFLPQVSIRIERGAQRPRVVVEVEPGESARVASVDIGFAGDVATSTDPVAVEQREGVRKDWSLPAGERFTQEAWDDAKQKALQTLLARRYPRARVADSRAAVDARAARAGLGLKLDSGPVFRLGPMAVTGAERYPTLLAERLARLPPGRIYDRQEIVDAQLRLTGSGYYDTAFIYVDPESDPDAAPVQVNLRETPIKRWVLGVGLTTDLGPHASVEFRHNRFPSSYWRTTTRLHIEEKNPLAEVELLSIPGTSGWRWAGQARASRLLDDDGLETRALRLRAGRSRAGLNVDREVYLQLDRASVRDTTGTLTESQRGDGSALMANYIVTWRYFDNPSLPTRGWGVGAELGAGYTLTGQQRPFQRTVLRGQTFYPLQASRIMLRAEAGAVFAADEAELPSTQLFRTGGDTTVRGYSYREIGVPRPNGLDAPGRYELVGSIEWIRPIRRNDQPTDLEHSVFIDAGAVADKPGDLRPVYGVGTGVRFLSPIGALQASVAYGLEARKLRLHLTVGVTF